MPPANDWLRARAQAGPSTGRQVGNQPSLRWRWSRWRGGMPRVAGRPRRTRAWRRVPAADNAL